MGQPGQKTNPATQVVNLFSKYKTNMFLSEEINLCGEEGALGIFYAFWINIKR